MRIFTAVRLCWIALRLMLLILDPSIYRVCEYEHTTVRYPDTNSVGSRFVQTRNTKVSPDNSRNLVVYQQRSRSQASSSYLWYETGPYTTINK